MNTPLMNCYNGCAEKFSGPTMILLQNILIVSLIIILVGLSSWLYQDDGGDFNWDINGTSNISNNIYNMHGTVKNMELPDEKFTSIATATLMDITMIAMATLDGVDF